MKNVIFDIGNVLLTFQPYQYLKQFYNQETIDDLMMIIFCSDEWEGLDLGTTTIDHAIDVLSKQNPIYKTEIAFVLRHWTTMLQPIQENIDLIPILKEKGYHLYLLSNFHNEAIDEMFQKYSFFKYFEGGIISARDHIIKPNHKIYELILDRYQLNAQECVFIDDSLGNLVIGENYGIKGIQYTIDTNLKEELKRIGIIL